MAGVKMELSTIAFFIALFTISLIRDAIEAKEKAKKDKEDGSSGVSSISLGSSDNSNSKETAARKLPPAFFTYNGVQLTLADCVDWVKNGLFCTNKFYAELKHPCKAMCPKT